jgi:hypothetical protein
MTAMSVRQKRRLRRAAGAAGFVALVAVIVGLATAVNRLSGGKANAALDVCAGNEIALAGFFDTATNAGLISGGRRTEVGRTVAYHYSVEEVGWSVLTHDQKINLTMAAFCRIAGPGSTGVAMLQGLRDGREKAAMVDGNFFAD